MKTLLDGELAAYDSADDKELVLIGGGGAHEVNSRTVAFAALQVSGIYKAARDCFNDIPEWLTGTGIMHAVPTDPCPILWWSQEMVERTRHRANEVFYNEIL